MPKRLPPQIGLEVEKSILYNPYQQEFLKARRLRFAPCCQKIGSCGSDGLFRCPSCGKLDMMSPRVYRRMGAFAGRRGGKTIVGAHAAREEMLVPDSIGWVAGPTEKILHDATMPTLLKLIPREWCQHWDAEHQELRLINNALIMFRSLHDPDRGHCGIGAHWAWFDEAAFIDEMAWHYFEPALTDFGGVAFFTSSVDGFDWTYNAIEKKALIEHKPGYWAAKWRTIDNPYMATYRSAEIADAKETMPPQLYRQEFEGERENFTGSVYAEFLGDVWLADQAAVRTYIPEWPDLDPARRIITGLDSGADHPFGAVALVATERGMVAVREYLERQRAFSAHLIPIQLQFPSGPNVMWAANKNEAQLRLEFAAHGLLVAPAESDQMAGIQRVLSWLYSGQFKIAYTCPKLLEQMKTLRFAENVSHDQQKRNEKVFKVEDELPDCVRYALMLWPSLPIPLMPTVGRNLSALDSRTQWEIQENARRTKLMTNEARDLTPVDDGYPLREFYGNNDDTDLLW